jgi:hypothetical protein
MPKQILIVTFRLGADVEAELRKNGVIPVRVPKGQSARLLEPTPMIAHSDQLLRAAVLGLHKGDGHGKACFVAELQSLISAFPPSPVQEVVKGETGS